MPLVADEVDTDDFARSNIWGAKNLDFAIVGFACLLSSRAPRPTEESNCSPASVRVQHASRNADVFVAGLDDHGGPPFLGRFLCDLIDHAEIVIHFSRADCRYCKKITAATANLITAITSSKFFCASVSPPLATNMPCRPT